MNTAVIDDSTDEACQLAGFISAYRPDTHTYQQTIISNTAADFLRCQQRGSFDPMFIGTFLRDETSDIRVAERARRDDGFYTIMFATSSMDFAPKGYEIRALNYMIRPIRYEKLYQTMKYFVSVPRGKQSHYIGIKESHIMFKIPIDSTLYTDYPNHYIQIHLPDKTVHTYMRLEEFSGMLLIYSQLICCYRNCITNMGKVFSMEKSGFTLTAEEHLPITRTIRSQIHQQYTGYQFFKLNGGI